MKIKQFVAGVLAGALAIAAVPFVASADIPWEYKLYDEVYEGSITITGTIDAGDTNLNIGDVLWLGISNAPQQAFVNKAAAESATPISTRFIPAKGKGTASDTSGTTYVYGTPGDTSTGLKLHGKLNTNNGKYAIGGVETDQSTWENSFVVSSIKIGNVNATLTGSTDRAGASNSVATSADNQSVIWKVAAVSDNYGILAKKDKVGTIAYTITFKYIGSEDPSSEAQKVIKALKNAKPEDKDEIGTANSFNILWDNGGTAGKFGTAGGFEKIPYSDLTATNWTTGDKKAALDQYKEEHPTTKWTITREWYEDTELTLTAIRTLVNAGDTAGDPWRTSTVTTKPTWNTLTGEQKDAIEVAKNVSKTSLTKEEYDSIIKVGTEEGGYTQAKPANNYDALLMQPKSTTVNLSGISTKKAFPRYSVNLIEKLPRKDLLAFEAAARAGKGIKVNLAFEKPLDHDKGELVYGYESFLGKDEIQKVEQLTKGDKDFEFVIPAEYVITTDGTFNAQYIWYLQGWDGGLQNSYQWNEEANTGNWERIDGFVAGGGNTAKKDPKAINVATITLSIDDGATTKYPATKDGALQAVKDYANGKITVDVAKGAVKAYANA